MRNRLIYLLIVLLVFSLSAFLIWMMLAFSNRSFSLYEGFRTYENNKVTSNLEGTLENDLDLEVEKDCFELNSIEYIYYKDTDLLWEKNNKFGLYIYAENRDFFEIAQNMVNSKGGEWGYVLIPYNVKDRDYMKWTRVFDQLRAKNLIPIIQLWDVDTDNYIEQTKEAAEFLDSFVWPIKYRYVSAYNEPNDGRFWYGRIDPEEYAKILDFTVSAFKELNPDFFIMNGAFNISAPSDGRHMDAFEYMNLMNKAVPGIFEKLDGWASHPYPQPNFSGSPYVSGRWSIRAYENELTYLKDFLKVEKELPVFITETGWAHAEGEIYNSTYLTLDVIEEYLKYAFEEVWNPDDRVRAVVLFTIWYEPPFDHFSYVNKDKVPYSHYEKLKSLDKINGDPPSLIISNVETTDCE